jgi:hypothetical protein
MSVRIENGPTMRFWTDFNDIVRGSRVEADLDEADYFLDGGLVVGASAELFDGEGHECRGHLVAINRDQRSVELQIDWNTWHTLHSPQRVKTFTLVGEPLAIFDSQAVSIGLTT